jgi:hypothetical protein
MLKKEKKIKEKENSAYRKVILQAKNLSLRSEKLR